MNKSGDSKGKEESRRKDGAGREMGEKRAHVPPVGLETNKMKFNKALYLERENNQSTSSGLGKPDLIAIHGKQT